MNDIYAILRYTEEQFSVMYASEDGFLHRHQELLQFINNCLLQKDIVYPSFSRTYDAGEQPLSLQFLSAGSTPAPSWLIVMQHTAHQPLNIQDIESFTEQLQLFFRKGAHDMKNLLSTLSMLLRGQSVEKAREYLAQVQNQYLAKLEEFYQALDTFVATEKPADPQIKLIYFQPLVERILAPYRRQTEEFSVETHFQSCEKIIYREDYLYNMLKSLIDNAIRYRSAGRKLLIRMHTESIQQDRVSFLIEDNGIGINMQHQHKLFTPFQRLTQQDNGQGISLHLVKLMAEKNGGSIQLHSTLHQGTSVELLLRAYT